jgi:hypothetical protein
MTREGASNSQIFQTAGLLSLLPMFNKFQSNFIEQKQKEMTHQEEPSLKQILIEELIKALTKGMLLYNHYFDNTIITKILIVRSVLTTFTFKKLIFMYFYDRNRNRALNQVDLDADYVDGISKFFYTYAIRFIHWLKGV